MALDVCPQPFLAVDADLRVVWWNQAAHRLTGHQPGDVLGSAPPVDDPDLLRAALARPDGHPVPFTALVDVHGDRVPVHLLHQMEIGAVVGWFLSPAGRSDRDAAAEELVDLRRRDRRRADWFAGVVHDLRTPVTAVLGFARTLTRAGEAMTAGERAEALATIERQAVRISRMLDDLMDSAMAEADALAPRRATVLALRDAVDAVVDALTPDERSRVAVHVQDALRVRGDADQLVRVVQNLVGNALGHAGPDVRVDVRASARGDRAVLQVADDGPGMPEGVEVFSRFARGHHGGWGMGLFTVKRIVELHGGTVGVESTAGEGTTVEVRLPLAG